MTESNLKRHQKSSCPLANASMPPPPASAPVTAMYGAPVKRSSPTPTDAPASPAEPPAKKSKVNPPTFELLRAWGAQQGKDGAQPGGLRSFLATARSHGHPLSASVESEIVKMDMRNTQVEWANAYDVEEFLDQWCDEQNAQVKAVTVAQRARHLRWVGRYKYAMGESTEDVLDLLDDLVQDLQAIGSRTTTETCLLAILDPYALNRLGHEVVNVLRTFEKDDFHPFLRRHYLEDETMGRSEYIKFGQSLRCFLDLALRFTNVPLRVQCTQRLMGMDMQDPEYVAKLTSRGSYLSRIVNRDKTGKSYQAVEVPMNATLSQYLMFYYRHCRADPTSHLVFQSSNGCQWRKASRDLKKFLRDRGFDASHVESNGRFIHGSRHIGLASFCVQVGFDNTKIEKYCTLLRTSLETVRGFYSPWLALYQSQDAVHTLMAAQGHEIPVPHKVRPIQLLGPPTELRSGLKGELQSDFAQRVHTRPVWGTRDQGSQTAAIKGGDTLYINCDRDVKTHHSSTPKTMAAADPLPSCGTCGQTQCVGGPIADSRSGRYGQYFTVCIQCSDKKKPNDQSRWYALGIRPMHKSVSYRPRNLQKVLDHIDKHMVKTQN